MNAYRDDNYLIYLKNNLIFYRSDLSWIHKVIILIFVSFLAFLIIDFALFFALLWNFFLFSVIGILFLFLYVLFISYSSFRVYRNSSFHYNSISKFIVKKYHNIDIITDFEKPKGYIDLVSNPDFTELNNDYSFNKVDLFVTKDSYFIFPMKIQEYEKSISLKIKHYRGFRFCKNLNEKIEGINEIRNYTVFEEINEEDVLLINFEDKATKNEVRLKLFLKGVIKDCF